MPDYLSAVGTLLQSLVGVNVNALHPPPLDPTEDLPILTYQQVDGRELESLSDLSNLTFTTIQISAWSVDRNQAVLIRDLVVSAIRGHTGPIPFTSFVLDAATNFRYRELFNGDQEVHQAILRVDLWWST